MQTYDLIVIGSGPAGQRAAIQAAKHGQRVALIERRDTVGGTCVNTGTIPSKTLREAVLHFSGHGSQGLYGQSYRKEKITMDDLSFRVEQVVQHEVGVARSQLARNGISVLCGVARFLNPHCLEIQSATGDMEVTAPQIIIATGTKPAESPRVPVNGRTILNSDQVLQLPELPKTLIVVGGGVIGVEYASMFAILGVRVILVERRPRILEFADTEMAEALAYHLRDRRVTLRLSEEVLSVEEDQGDVIARLESNKLVRGSALLYAVGRHGNVEELNLEAAGLEADSRGRIPVDAEYRTKQRHIFAVGDVIGFPSLASVSLEQGRQAAAHAVGNPLAPGSSNYPYGIYTIPELSFIGQTEEQLTDGDVPYEVGVAFYREIARGQIRGDTSGRLKLIFHRETKKILGIHIIGEGATELLHLGQAVMLLGGTVDYFIDTIFNYPTLAQCYKAAAFNGLNRLTGTRSSVTAAR